MIGGGIIGAGIADEAARAGLTVALVDKGDFGAATSSSSSKLIHGGLRYLRLGDVGLVREAHKERRALMRVVAPHLVRRLPFLFPVYEDGPYRGFTIQTGLWLYSTLARERLGGARSARALARSIPSLRLEEPARLRPLRRRLDARQPPLPRECPRRRRCGRDRPQLRRGDRAPHGGRARRGSGCRDLLGGETASVSARRRERDRAVGRPAPPARGSAARLRPSA